MISTFYSYANNSDRLISYNNEKTGFAGFEYDEIGNPTVYKGKLASWENGRQMVAFDGHTFAYDARGRRTRKDNITFIYDSDGNLIRQSDGLEFLYDHTGVFAVKYDNATYYYRKDAQGNVIALLDNTGAVVVEYAYDAWGNCLETVLDIHATGIANLNPFRYRGYYYDVETKLYFLKTRYYDPKIGRFITIDDISYLDPESINGLNLYAYCGNNPVNMVDPNGTLKWYQWLGIVGAVLVVAAATILTCGAAGVAIGGAGLVGAVVHGAAVGALIGAGIGAVGGAIGGGIYSAVTGADFWSSVGAGAMAGLGIGAIIGAVVGGFSGANGWYNKMAEEFTHIGTTNEVVLGKTEDAYWEVGKANKATYFHTSPERWKEVESYFGVGKKGMWRINRAFLKQQISAGRTFTLVSNPVDLEFRGLFKELSYIVSKGFGYLVGF